MAKVPKVGVMVGDEVTVGVNVEVKVKVGVGVKVAVGWAMVIIAPPTPAIGTDVTARGFPELTPVPITLPAVKVTA